MTESIIKPGTPLATAHIADVSDYGFLMSPRMQAVWAGAKCAGPAFTVQTAPGDNASLHQSLDLVRAGEVIVVDGQEFLKRALWGAIMSKAAQVKGVAGIVMTGAVRDVDEIRELGFPAFAYGRSPATPYNKIRGRVGVPIVCGGIEVNPGDIVYADEDGVMVIPQSENLATVARAHHREKLEHEIIEGLDRGKPLSSLLGILRQPPEATSDKKSDKNEGSK